jgi:hypothetical protein
MARLVSYARLAGCLAILALLVPAAALGGDRSPPSPAEVVELFDAVDAGRIETRIIPRDSTTCRLMLTNKTDQPLTVRLPAVFAAVPVLAQFGDIGQQANRQSSPQPLGLSPMQNNGNNRGGPFNVGNQRNNQNLFGPMFNIPPERVVGVKIPAACLQHGLATPRASMPYEIKPLGAVTSTPGVAELCAMLSDGTTPQRVVQLAVWHVNNGVEWRTLAADSPREAAAAKKLAAKVLEEVRLREAASPANLSSN